MPKKKARGQALKKVIKAKKTNRKLKRRIDLLNKMKKNKSRVYSA